MIKYLTKRHTSNIYTLDVIDEIYSDLGIVLIDKSTLHEVLEQSAISFKRNKDRQSKRYSPAGQRRSFKKLYNYLSKSKKQYQEIANQQAIFDYYDMIRENQTKFKDEKDIILENYMKGFILNSKFIEGILENLQNAAFHAANQKSIQFAKRNDTEIVLMWLIEIARLWEKVSNINISEGRNRGAGNESPAMRILDKIVKPLNDTLNNKDRITNSEITEAIKMYRSMND